MSGFSVKSSCSWWTKYDLLPFCSTFCFNQVPKVHILNESRGSTLEVVISRMKARGSDVRFVLVSATVPNIDDVASWIGGPKNQPARTFEVSLSFFVSLSWT